MNHSILTPDQRRERERQDTRQTILDAARELFIAEGYDGVSMRKVARKIGYSPTAIYDYFVDKEDLFLGLCHSDFHRLAETFVQIASVPDPVERLRGIGRGYVGFGLKNPNHYRMMFMTAHPHASEEKLREVQMGKGNPEEDAYAFLLLTVTQAMEAGAFRKDLQDPHAVAQTLWAGTHGVVSLHIAKGDDDWVPWCPIRDRMELMLDALLDGLLKKKD